MAVVDMLIAEGEGLKARMHADTTEQAPILYMLKDFSPFSSGATPAADSGFGWIAADAVHPILIQRSI